MKPHHYLAIVIRLFAIALLVYTVRQTSLAFELLITGDISGFKAPAILVVPLVALPLIVSVLLWFFPIAAAKTVLKPELDQTIELTNKISIFPVIVASIGLFVTFYAVVDAVYYFTLWQLVDVSDYGSIQEFLGPEVKASVCATIIELTLGLLLVFKAKFIAQKIFAMAG